MRSNLILSICLCVIAPALGQNKTTPVAPINIGYSNNFSGFELMDMNSSKAFIIAEDVHNRKYAPAFTLKFLQCLYHQKNIRTLAIEGGASTAYLINLFLENQDTVLLREIVRHTFYWSREHHAYYLQLAAWNKTLPADKRITVESADIEIKQESVILAMNILLKEKKIPHGMTVLETFRKIFSEKENHRNQYMGLNLQYYYDRKECSNLVDQVLVHLKVNSDAYKVFFGAEFDLFKTMMIDLQAQYVFDYRTNTKFKFRDDIMYEKLVHLAEKHPEGFLHIVGAKHTRPGASSYRLKYDSLSPFCNQVIIINTTGRSKNGKYTGAKVVTRIAAEYPSAFNADFHTIIKNDGRSELFNKNLFDYTLALSDNDHVTPFPNSYTGK